MSKKSLLTQEFQPLSREREILLKASQTLNASLNLPMVMQRITEYATSLINVETGAFYLLQGENIYLGATTPPLPDDFPEGFRIAPLVDHPHIQKAVESQKPVVVADTRAENLTEAEKAVIEARGLRSLIYVPLLSGEKRTGVFIIGTIGKTRIFTDEDVDLCSTLANQAAIAVQNARLLEETRKQANLFESLSRFSQVLSENLKYEHVINLVVEHVSEITGDGCLLGLLNDDENAMEIAALHCQSHQDQESMLECFNSVSVCDVKQLMMESVATGRPITYDFQDESMAPSPSEQNAQPESDHLPIRGIYITPLRFSGKNIGALCIVRKNSDSQFSSSDRYLLQNLADRAAPTIVNVRLYAELEKKFNEQTRELQFSEERYRQIVDSSPEAIAVHCNQKIVFVNPATIELFGAKNASELIGKNAIDLIHPDFRANVIKRMQAGYEKRKKLPPIREKFLRIDGSSVEVEVMSTPVEFQGKPAMQVIARDISSRKREEMRLFAQNAVTRIISKATSIEEAMPLILRDICKAFNWQIGELWQVDEVKNILRCDMIWAQPDFPAENLIKKTREITIAPGKGIAGQVWLEPEAIWYSDIQNVQVFSRFSLAKKYNLHTMVALPIECEGKVIGVLQLFNQKIIPVDMVLLTTLETISTAISQFSERLKAEQLLREAKLEAERANHAKSEFISRMSHELRTPLNAVIGFSELLKMDEMSDEQLDNVDRIHKSGKHLLAMINEILDIARIEARRHKASLEPVSVQAVIDDALELVRPLAKKHQIKTIIDSSDFEKIKLKADRQYFKQVLINLLSNAVKYNRSNGTIHISGCESPVSDKYFRVIVQDTGPGISDENMSRLFVPFERLGAELTSQEGTGLGLVYSKHLMEVMGGRIGVESTPGEGSSFWVELRCTEEKANEKIAPAIDENISDVEQQLQGVVFYIEDNLNNIELMEAIVRRIPGLKLLSTGMGTTAMDIAKEHRPDLILLDLHLPDIDGEDVLEKLKQDQDVKNIPVIILSAEASSEQQDKLLKQGANGYLTKPIEIMSFLKAIGEYLRKK